MEYRTQKDAEAAFCFIVTRRVKSSWVDSHTWCERCGYEIPYGEDIVVLHDIYKEHPIQIYHGDCYASKPYPLYSTRRGRGGRTADPN